MRLKPLLFLHQQALGVILNMETHSTSRSQGFQAVRIAASIEECLAVSAILPDASTPLRIDRSGRGLSVSVSLGWPCKRDWEVTSGADFHQDSRAILNGSGSNIIRFVFLNHHSVWQDESW